MEKSLALLDAKRTHSVVSDLGIDEVIRSIQEIDGEIEKLVFEKRSYPSRTKKAPESDPPPRLNK